MSATYSKSDHCRLSTVLSSDQVNGSEDCLYLGLYSRPWNTGQPLRPVVVTFYGGGYIQGGGSFSIPPSAYPILNVSSTSNLLFVYPNYRVNAFGFLPGAQVGRSNTSDANAGLLDQQAVLLWTHKYISQFGGDPKNVTIWGQSAGGGSVAAHVIANGGKTTPKLFTKALTSSPFWGKTYRYDAPEAQAVYDRMASLTNCTGPSSLACMKSAPVQTIRDASLILSTSHQYGTSQFTWNPVIDGKFLTQLLSQATLKGEVNSDFGWGMYNTHEGENFIPPGFANIISSGTPPYNSSTASLHLYLQTSLPGLSPSAISRIETLYALNSSTETIASLSTTYLRAGQIFRDTTLACPAYWLALAAKKKSYLGEYIISPAKHASDTIYWNQVNAVQKSDPLVYEGYAGAFASFFVTGDPNALKLTNASQAGVPDLKGMGQQFVVESTGFVDVKVVQLKERCEFWRSVAGDIPI